MEWWISLHEEGGNPGKTKLLKVKKLKGGKRSGT